VDGGPTIMKIGDPPPTPPPGYVVMALCDFCDEAHHDFLILKNRDVHCVMCIICITQLVDVASERFFATADSQAGS
jgi:hypothetical protein